MRGFVLSVLAVLVLLSPAVPTVQAHSPSVTSPAILSYADPELIANRTTNYTLVANGAVTWSCVACPRSTFLAGSPSPNAGLSISPIASGTLTFSVEASSGGLHTWQNWTTTVITTPAISSTPAFFVTVGGLYRYVPVVANPSSGSWTFSGAPYLSLDATTGTVSSNPGGCSAGTFQNTLVYHSGSDNYTQTWWTTSGSLPTTILVSGHLGAHYLNATLPTTDVAAIGANGVFDGTYPLFTLTAGTDSYTASWDGLFNYSLAWKSGAVRSETLWWYATPGTAPVVRLNGNSIGNGVAPSSGFTGFATPTVPRAPSGLSITASGTLNLNLSWTNPTGGGIVNDTVVAGTSCGSWTYVRSIGMVTSYIFSGLPPSTHLCVAVASWNGSGEGPFAYVNGTTLAVPPAISFTASSTGVTVSASWTIPASITYSAETVYIGTACGTWIAQRLLFPPTHSTTFTEYALGTYCLGITLTTGTYTSTFRYANATVVGTGAPPKVSGLGVVVIATTSVTLSWNATLTNTTGYVLYWGLLCGSYTNSANIALGITTYAASPLVPGTVYCFTVGAVNGSIAGPLSNPVTATTHTSGGGGNGSGGVPGTNNTPVFSAANLWPLLVIGGAAVVIAVVAYSKRNQFKRPRSP